MQKVMKIEGMMCPRCVAHVEKALGAIPGVTVAVSLEAGTATVTGEVENDVLTNAVTEAGYTVLGIE